MPKGISSISGKSLTRQADRAGSDINHIMRQYTQGGHVSPLVYGDLTQVPTTLQGAFDLVAKASDAFASLPAAVRFRFRNHPASLLSFLADPANKPEAIKLGLLPPEPPDPIEEAAERQVRQDELVAAKKASRGARNPTPKVPPEGA